MRLFNNFLICLTLFCLITVTGFTMEYDPNWESLDSRPMPKWFTEAKFGIFIHWGVYSVPAWRPLSSKRYASYAEWYYARVIGDKQHGGDAFHRKNFGEEFEYRDFAPSFKAELFEPDFWADLFQKSGAKYVVLTSKHHDGFCLWPTKSPYKKNWNSMVIGPKRDLVGELATAVRKKGLKMGLYYSLIEWETNPTGRTETGFWLAEKTIKKYNIPLDKYVSHHIIPQLKELVMDYSPSLIFSDGGEWDENEHFWRVKEFLAWLYNQAPNKDEVVVNDRWAKGMPGKHGDYFSSEYKDTEAIGPQHPWEESRGIGGSYGFNRAENIKDYSTSKQLVWELAEIVSKGGNLLLNVGPTADGRIPVIMQQRLLDMGEWLSINGEAIYGTKPWLKRDMGNPGLSFPALFTVKGKDLYLICSQWPKNEIYISIPENKLPIQVTLLGVNKSVLWKKSKDGIFITTPIVTPSDIRCHYAYVFKIANSL